MKRMAGFLMILSVAAGCTLAPKLETAQDVADHLKDKGIDWKTSDAIVFTDMRFAKIDEGLSLTGDGLRIEVLRISDKRTFDIMGSAAALLGIVDVKLNEEALGPPDIYRVHPFVVVIRQEPEEGATRAVLEKALPIE